MSIYSKRKLGLFVAAATLSAGSFSAPVYAEDDQEEAIEEVVVTGSRIPRTGFDTMLPANVINSEFMERRAYTNVADALNEVTSFGSPGSSPGVGDAANASDQATYSGGQNYVNFFGMGSQRTLTLVNGKRFVSSSTPSLFTNQAPGLQVDLNVIPGSMVERVETVAVGGAPIYGADAIAGTVNVILKDDFEGLEISTSYGETADEGDIEETVFELVYGGNFDNGRGNLVVGIEINDRGGAVRSDRDHLAAGWQWRTSDGTTGFDRQLIPNGTANIVANGGLITPLGSPALVNFGLGSVTTDADGNPQWLAFQPDGSLGPYDIGLPTPDAVWSIGGDGIFFPSLNSLYTPVNRKIATAFANYDLTDNIELYGELYIANTETEELVNQPAYQSAFFPQESAALNFSADHPLLTPTARQQLADIGLTEFSLHRASVDLGSGNVVNEGELWRIVAGLRGDFEIADRTVSWDFAWIKGESKATITQDEIINDRFFYAIDVVDVGNGPECRVVADPSSRPPQSGEADGIFLRTNTFDDCVPLNLFGEGAPSQAAKDYIGAVATASSLIEQQVYSLNANIGLFDLPAGEFAVAVGFEHREEKGSFGTDGVTRLGLGRSVPVDSTSGAYETDEWYAEIYAPVVSPDMDIPLVHSASIEGAFRQVDNSFAGKDDVHTIGGRWAPIADIEFRGNATRSVRAPAITELFLPLSGTNSFANDPCDQANVDSGPAPANRRANCIAAGIDVETFSSNVRNASVQGLTGGNINLNNEIADAYTYGVILRPRWVEDLTVAIDYVDIEVEESIENFSLTQIMESCYDASSYPTAFCGQFTRGADGQIVSPNGFVSGYVNAGLRTLQGTTVEFDWFSDLSTWPGFKNLDNPGALSISGNMFFPSEAETLIQGAVVDNLNLPFMAEEQIQVNFTYFWNNLTVLWQTRYIGETVVETDISPTRYPDDTLDAVFFHNLGVTYEFNEMVTVSLNVNNVFDEEPEKSAIARGYDVQYDNIGRYLRAGVKVSL
ncbi:MAG: TonB-dependent receptor [Pseudomonadales bacterium]|nr:TonB-dependent receptor [Pseudomonadales bacterium]